MRAKITMKPKLPIYLVLLALISLSACAPGTSDEPTDAPASAAVIPDAVATPVHIESEIEFVSDNGIRFISTAIDLASAMQIAAVRKRMIRVHRHSGRPPVDVTAKN